MVVSTSMKWMVSVPQRCSTILSLTCEIAWQSVVLAINKTPLKFPVLFTFLTIEVDPLLQFPAEHHEIRGFELPLGSLETPENTPQASTPSPDISGIGSTPGGGAQASTPPANTAFGDHDAEARLVDVTDETWGIVMSHSVSDVCIPSDFCPALVSGYLLKRCGPREEDGVMRIGVNVIRGQKPHRPLLKAVLGMYRNLGLLARIRGIVDPVKSMDPYHVAVARKAQATLTATMRYGET